MTPLFYVRGADRHTSNLYYSRPRDEFNRKPVTPRTGYWSLIFQVHGVINSAV